MCVTLSVIFRKKVEAGEIKMANFLGKIREVVFTGRARENVMDEENQQAEINVIRSRRTGWWAAGS